MKKRDLLPLFLINSIVYFVGTGLMPILPLYASRFGVKSSGTGLYIAAIFAAITAGSLLTGRLAHRYSPRAIFLLSGLLGVPALVLLGRSSAFWQVVLLTAAVWFLAGIGTALVNIQAGLLASRNKRGQSFGLMFLALPVASLIAGLTIGRLVEWRGFRFMFDVLAIIWATWLLLAILVPNHKPEKRSAKRSTAATSQKSPFSAIFYILVATTLLSASAFYLTRLGTTFSLSSLGFSPSAIASTTSIGGLVAIPATYIISTLSDRLSRRHIVVLGYLFAIAATVTMSVAGDLWHFWLATGMLYLSRSINGSVAPALATDLLERDDLGRGLSYLSATNWLAGIVGSAIAGFGIERLGQTNLFLSAAGLAFTAVLLMGLVSASRHIKLPVTQKLAPFN